MRSIQYQIALGVVATTATVGALIGTLVVGKNSPWYYVIFIALIPAVFTALLVRVSYREGRTAYRKVRIALAGIPQVGKTVYLNVLFDTLQTDPTLPFGFAPSSETINRVLSVMTSLSAGKWITKTPSDYLYLYSARLSLQRATISGRPARGHEYQLEVADAAGEQIGEFVPGERSYTAKTSYYSYTLESDALFLFIDYPAIEPSAVTVTEPAGSLSYQVNDLIFVIQAVADAAKVGPSQLLDNPVAIIITKCDLDKRVRMAEKPLKTVADIATELSGTMDDLPGVISEFTDPRSRAELSRLIAVARARCKWVGLFTVSSVGPPPGPSNRPDMPPDQIHPINVSAPLRWMLETQPRKIGRLVRE